MEDLKIELVEDLKIELVEDLKIELVEDLSNLWGIMVGGRLCGG